VTNGPIKPRPDLPDPGREEGEPLWPWFYVMCAVIVGMFVLFVVMTA